MDGDTDCNGDTLIETRFDDDDCKIKLSTEGIDK